jgi:hypothetical protein
MMGAFLPARRGTMRKTGRFVVVLAICGSSACGSGSPTEPSPRAGYAGTWTGPTSQGGAITFTVSPEQKVVAIAVDYRLNGCSGNAVLPGLSLEIAAPQLAPGSPNAGGPFDNPSFGSGSQGVDQPNFLGVSGTFTSSDAAKGVLIFGEYAGCGSGLATWMAARR